MKTAIITVNQTGRTVADKICHTLDATLLARHEVGARWNDFDDFVFVGAMGICVRTIAPYIEDKHSDPAVVCVDTLGRSAVAVLSGHVGGANELAQRVAAAIGAQPVVTTQSDLAGLWALDTLEKEYGWHREMPDDMNACIFDFVNRRPTALFLEADDEGCRYLRETLPEHVTLVERLEEATADRYRLLIMVTPYRHEVPQGMHCVWFVPRVATIGFGLAHHPADYQDILSLMEQRMEEQGLAPACARQYCTIDVKADEPFVRLLRDRGCDVRFFTAEELSSVEVPHPSATVEKHVGTPSVCEAAAILGSGGGTANPALTFYGQLWDGALSRDMLNKYLFKAPFRMSREWEDRFVEASTHMRVGPDYYPGDYGLSWKWPYIVAGNRGVLNTMSPQHGNLRAFLDVEPKPEILWIRGDDDQIVSDHSMMELGYLGSIGMVPGWPGKKTYPPQPMVAQTRWFLDQYQKKGGRYAELVIPGGHVCILESPLHFISALKTFTS
mgnify:CR=1 FL=1